MGTSMEPLQDPVAGRPGDQIIGRSGDVCRTSVKHVFKIQFKNILNLLYMYVCTKLFKVGQIYINCKK